MFINNFQELSAENWNQRIFTSQQKNIQNKPSYLFSNIEPTIQPDVQTSHTN